MATVKTWKELEKALRQARDKSLKGAGEKATKVVKDRIDSDVYDAYSPEWYDRTGQLRDSVDVTDKKFDKDKAEIQISHNEEKIVANAKLGQHASVVDGRSSVESIAEIVHNGKTGAVWQGGYWKDTSWYDSSDTFATPRPYMDNAKEEMKDGKYKKFMEEELNKMGIKTK